MRSPAPRSLRWTLVVALVSTQAIIIVLAGIMMFIQTMQYVRENPDNLAFQGFAADVIQSAVRVQPDGRLAVEKTAELQQLTQSAKNFWFILSAPAGVIQSYGTPPAEFDDYRGLLSRMDSAILLPAPGGDASNGVSIISFEKSGQRLQIALGGTSPLMIAEVWGFAVSLLWQAAEIVILVTVSTALVTPFVVKRALRPLSRAAEEASALDFNGPTSRLSDDKIPPDIAPVVRSMNGALDRLDEALQKHRRFIADAAHELRTPVAILTTRLSALPSGQLKTRLLEDAHRLNSLTGQLLDIRRLDSQHHPLLPQDLRALAQQAVLDLAPLAFAAGYEVKFETGSEHVPVLGDKTSIERALANLIQNAISHGGRQGTITVHVHGTCIDVCDEGPGVAPHNRDRIFEAFNTGGKAGQGAGLGLDLVRQIMTLHGGSIELVDDAGSGACFRLCFPQDGIDPVA